MEPLVAGSKFQTLAPARRRPGLLSASGLHLPAVFVVGEERTVQVLYWQSPEALWAPLALSLLPSPSLSISLCMPEQRCLSHWRLTATAATRRPFLHPHPRGSERKKNVSQQQKKKSVLIWHEQQGHVTGVQKVEKAQRSWWDLNVFAGVIQPPLGAAPTSACFACCSAPCRNAIWGS